MKKPLSERLQALFDEGIKGGLFTPSYTAYMQKIIYSIRLRELRSTTTTSKE
jgi:hypothetical protein